MNRLHKRPRKELKDLLKNEKIVEFNTRGQAKPQLKPARLDGDESTFRLELASEMEPREYEGFLTLLWDTQVCS